MYVCVSSGIVGLAAKVVAFFTQLNQCLGLSALTNDPFLTAVLLYSPFDEGGRQTWINNLKPLWLPSSLLLCETFKSNTGSKGRLLTFATGAPMLASMCFSAGIRRLTCLVLPKVRWLLVQEREEGPNVNSSSSKRVVLQEPLKEPEGIRTVCQPSLVVAWSYIMIVWNICRL